MPANLSPEYIKAEREYRAAATPEEKLMWSERMLQVIPKHKGTDKLQGELKQRISKLKQGLEQKTRKKGPSYRVKPEGAGQVVMLGPPNGGKSRLVGALTHASPEVAEYPCTTREPIPGMALYQDVQIQLVDLPPVWREHCESFVFDNTRASDGALLVIDLNSPDPGNDVTETLAFLAEKHIELVPPRTDPVNTKREFGCVEALLVINKHDLDPTGELIPLVKEMVGYRLPVHIVSAKTGEGLDGLRRGLFDLLHVIRIYTKQHGKPPDMDVPFTVPIGSTVLDFAGHVHKDFAEQFKSARVWGSAKFDGQVVQRDHVLADRDIVEIEA